MKRSLLLAFCAVLVVGCTSYPRKAPTPYYTTDEGAVKGYDAVAYHLDGRAEKGDREFSYMWQDSVWYFKNEEHRDLFAESPVKYAPQYGGYCAYAIVNHEAVPIDPNAWDIVDGKLYLNFSIPIQRKWRESRDEYIEKADEIWPDMIY